MLSNDLFCELFKKSGALLEKKITKELTEAYYEELKHYGDHDFEFAMKRILRFEKRFPSPAIIHEYVSKAISERVEVQAEEEKQKEEREVESFLRAKAKDPCESERNKARAREIIEAIGKGKPAVDKLTEKYHKENREEKEMEFPPEPSCVCDNGTVLIRDHEGYTSVAGCAICGKGNQNLAQVDPATLELKRDIRHSAWR